MIGTNLAVMGVTYLYQVDASRRLSPDAFFALSLWLGQLAIVGILATFAHVRGTLVPLRARSVWVSRSQSAQVFTALALVSYHLARPGRLSPNVLITETALVGVAAAYGSGTLTGRLRLLGVANAGLVSAIARIAFAAAYAARGPIVFYEANAVSAVVLLGLVAIQLQSTSSLESLDPPTQGARSWGAVIVVGLMQAALPHVQLFIARAGAPASEAPTLASVIVFSRAPLMLGMAVLSIAMAKHLRLGSRLAPSDSVGAWLTRYSFEVVAVGQCAVAAVFFYIAGPAIAARVTGAHIAHARATFALSTLDHAFLLLCFAIMQHAVVRSRVNHAVALLAGVALPITLALALIKASINTWLVAHIATITVALIALYIYSQKPDTVTPESNS